jgi:hypothetical protein
MNENYTIENDSRWCVLLPCSAQESWAVPQKCLAEIVTLPADGTSPPTQLFWRGRDVPILDLGVDNAAPWRDSRASTGLIAVMLGLKGGSWDYYGVALRGGGLTMKDLSREDIEDVPELVCEGSSSAFRMNGEIYQVPDMASLPGRQDSERSAAA